VLITGGFGQDESALASAELFDPETKVFTVIGDMNSPRLDATATLLPDGKVLIAGGFNGDYLTSAELFDPETNLFKPVAPMNEGRSGHQAVRLPSGKVLLIGGVGDGWTFLASAELYDPVQQSFLPVGSMTVPRESHTATLLGDGRVLVTGGHEGRRENIRVFASAEIYDPATGEFTTVADMEVARHKHDAVLLANGSVMVMGGADERDSKGQLSSVEIFDVLNGKWENAGILPTPRYKFNNTSLLMPNGSVLMLAGANTSEYYDPITQIFDSIPNGVHFPRYFATTTLLPNGNVLLAGGYGTNISASADTWLFQP
jgi:hypothetical protein